MVSGSRPERRQAGGISGGTRGARPSAAAAIAVMCSGVVPQQPPTTFVRPDSTNSRRYEAVWSGVSSYSPNALGSPAFGWLETKQSAIRDSSAR